ncbi:MAG TPA: hypothetical protein VL691_01505 [Vicinamibacteria bacterium]|nr:hypothetical protein [Vicinamibacteria bacterium]
MRKSLGRRFALAVALAGLSAGAAQAQSFYSGRLTLPFEVRWGGATLPAGEYSLSMNSIKGPLNVIDADGRVRVLVYGIPDPPLKTQPTSLLITRDGRDRTVRSFNCPAWGRKFVYKPFTRAERDMLASGEQAETVAVRMASR